MTWDPTKPAGTDAANTIDDSVIANNTALDTWASAITDGIAQAGATIFKMYRAANATIAKFRAAAGDTFDRFTCDLNGKMGWGSGGVAQDVFVERTGAGLIGATTGAITIGVATLKSGSGAGNYAITSGSYVDVDATNLAYTVTVPTGQKMMIVCTGAWTFVLNTVNRTAQVALTDGTTLLREATFGLVMGTSGEQYAGSLAISYLFTGDGASHTFKLRALTTDGSNTFTIKNTSSTDTPSMLFLMAAA